jgi:pimeloyl-ACP methyl ester carboxylesterase
MPTVTLPHGEVHYRDTGPHDPPTSPPVVFVHGILVDSQMWSAVASHLAADGVRSLAPDLPLGAHTRPVASTADQSPRGVARQVIAFLECLDLTDVTLVGNDTGGAICQYLLDTDASRIGRLVLTNCDCFDQFPPSSLQRFMEVMRRPAAIAGVAQAMRSTTFRHGRFGYGPFAREYDTAMTRAWIEPLRTDPRIREDVARFAAAVDASDLTAVATRLHQFSGSVRLVWGNADPYFPMELGHRLAATFRDATLTEVDARTFVPLDASAQLAAEIIDLSVGTASQRTVVKDKTTKSGGSRRAAR